MKLSSSFFMLLFTIQCVNLSAQKFPENFKNNVSREYQSISKELNEIDKKLTFEEYFKLRKNEYLVSQEFYKSLVIKKDVSGLCENGTFESGNINSNAWSFSWGGAKYGSTYNANYGNNMINSGAFSGADHHLLVHHQAMTSGPDPNIPSLSRVWTYPPPSNTTAVRLGNQGVGKGFESMAKTITVTAANSQLTFSYAMVVQNPGHGPDSDPSFSLNIIDARNTSVDYNSLVNLGGNGINFVTSSHPLLKTFNGIQYKDWTCVTVDLSSLIGKTVIIEFKNRDCLAGGHWGYSYIDNVCVSCSDSPGDEGAISLNVGQTDICGIPGQICIDYTLPNGKNPSLNLNLEIIQNGVIVNNLNSPTLNSGSTYCFSLNSTNTSGLNLGLEGFDFKITGIPSIGTFPLAPKIIGNNNTGIEQGKNNDYNLSCSQCCPGKNLIRNGNFENGNLGFSSDYSYQSAIGLNSIVPGQYGVVNGNQASIISPTWSNIQDPVSCSGSIGNFLVVNGENGGSVPSQKIIWEQTISVNDWKGFKFCMKAKNLNQCGFNVVPKIDIVFSMPQLGNITETINLSASNSCEWKEIQQIFNLWGYGNFLNVKIILDQNQLGDGNDIAIDDIALIELPQANIQLASFGVTPPVSSGGGNFSFSAIPNPLPADCYFAWEVCELDNNDQCINSTKIFSPSQWEIVGPFNFVGYNGTTSLSGSNPGIFNYSKKYRITRGVWCDCESWNQYSVDVNSTVNAVIFKNSKTGKIVSKTKLSRFKRRN